MAWLYAEVKRNQWSEAMCEASKVTAAEPRWAIGNRAWVPFELTERGLIPRPFRGLPIHDHEEALQDIQDNPGDWGEDGGDE